MRRKTLQPEPNCPLYRALDGAPRRHARTRIISGAESYRLAAETRELAAEAERVRAARREQEALR